MSNLINYLNSRSVHFRKPIRIDSIHKISAFDIAATFSFSKMSPISYNIIRAKFLDESSHIHLEKIANQIILENEYDVFSKKCIIIALLEFCNIPTGQKATIKSRIRYLNISRYSYKKYFIDDLINRATANFA